ncbi:pancreatic lipase-related protein 2 isoform X2 [Nasonia vitripennis]|uniref:phospholipase A1 n=1 Tax=Nasonia vitripennis TaxID=7425 RepID=A0A7M7QN18_NASVI|nr:pancreatic lipase-related protein 2 isoform X2 [Nasonia vitripennis]
MMFNETLLMLIYTANLLSTPHNRNQKREDRQVFTTTSTTQQSADLDESIFEYDDEWYMWRCYQPFGCFYIGTPWSGGSRPVSTFPTKPDSINPLFMLYTRDRVDDPHELVIDRISTIRDSPLRRNENLYFIIHGYLDNGNKTWVLRMMNELLLRENCNVVVINWIGGAGPPYTQAVANTRLVGAMTGRLASQLIQKGKMQASRLHCIGHSLGAHTCGYVGHNLRVQYGYKLGRITGLDPAEPHFSNTSPLVRLDPSDADFVTAIHTDCSPFISGGLGISQPVAHIDFFPNGGRNQPGCNEGVFNSITLEKGSFFREAHYRVTINVSKTNESLNYGGEVGMFVIRVIGPNGKMTERLSLSEHSKYYEPGTRHTAVIPGDVVGKVEAVEITWDYQTSMFNPLTWRLLHKPKAYIDSLTIKSLEFQNEITVCPASSKTLVANEPQILKVENCRYISDLNFVST